MNVLVVGAGALGSIYAAFLARAGHATALLARGDRATALAHHGIGVTGLATFRADCEIVTHPASLQDREFDLVIIAVKTYDTESALAPLAGVRASAAISVQNGVLKNDQLSTFFGQESVLGAVGMLGGEVLAAQGDKPGDVDYKMAGATVVGELDGHDSDRVQRTVDALKNAGLNASASHCIASVEWSKFVGWSGVSALAVLTRLPTYRFLVDRDTATLTARVIRETASVAAALGIPLTDSGMTGAAIIGDSESVAVDALIEHGKRMRESAPGFRQSILQDAERNRRLEVDETLGYTLARAVELGIELPTLDYCCRVLRAVSRSAPPR